MPTVQLAPWLPMTWAPCLVAFSAPTLPNHDRAHKGIIAHQEQRLKPISLVHQEPSTLLFLCIWLKIAPIVCLECTVQPLAWLGLQATVLQVISAQEVRTPQRHLVEISGMNVLSGITALLVLPFQSLVHQGHLTARQVPYLSNSAAPARAENTVTSLPLMLLQLFVDLAFIARLEQQRENRAIAPLAITVREELRPLLIVRQEATKTRRDSLLARFARRHIIATTVTIRWVSITLSRDLARLGTSVQMLRALQRNTLVLSALTTIAHYFTKPPIACLVHQGFIATALV